MFLLYEYEIFWAFLIISSVIPILAFSISRVLALISKEFEKLSSYELSIEPIGDALLQFRICYYMFALVFVVFYVETVFLYLYPWAVSGIEFQCIWCIHIYRSFHFCAYPNCWFSLCMAKRRLGMVLAPEYSEKKKKKGITYTIDTVMNSIKFPLLDRKTKILVISTTLKDLSN